MNDLKKTVNRGITVEDIRNEIICDFSTGDCSRKDGTPLSKHVCEINAYKRVTIKGVSFQQHVIVWTLYYGYFPDGDLNHKDTIKTNNSITNLEPTNKSLNKICTTKDSTSKTGIRGVFERKRGVKKYQATMARRGQPGKRHIYYIAFTTKKEAVMARWYMERKENYEDKTPLSHAYNYLKEHDMVQEALIKEEPFWKNYKRSNVSECYYVLS